MRTAGREGKVLEKVVATVSRVESVLQPGCSRLPANLGGSRISHMGGVCLALIVNFTEPRISREETPERVTVFLSLVCGSAHHFPSR